MAWVHQAPTQSDLSTTDCSLRLRVPCSWSQTLPHAFYAKAQVQFCQEPLRAQPSARLCRCLPVLGRAYPWWCRSRSRVGTRGGSCGASEAGWCASPAGTRPSGGGQSTCGTTCGSGWSWLWRWWGQRRNTPRDRSHTAPLQNTRAAVNTTDGKAHFCQDNVLPGQSCLLLQELTKASPKLLWHKCHKSQWAISNSQMSQDRLGSARVCQHTMNRKSNWVYRL